MRVTDVDVTETGRGAKLSATFVWDAKRPPDHIHLIYRETPARDLVAPGDTLLAAALVPSVVLHEDVVLDVPVSSKLLVSAPQIVDYFVSHNPRWHRSRVDAPTADRSSLAPTEVAAPFSGGVDSFYTALRPRAEPITLLITMLGVDFSHIVARSEPRMRDLSRAAAAMSKRHLVVECNAYTTMARHFPPGPRGVAILGSLVIGQALALGSRVRRLHVASTGAPTAFDGTHPDVDHLWTTESMQVVHDTGPRRFERVRAIASSPMVNDMVLVCTQRRPDVGNCGRCAKCVITALLFQLSGALPRTFESVTPARVRKAIVGPSWTPTLEQALEHTTDPAMRRALRYALVKARLRSRLRPLGTLLRRLRLR